MSTNEEAFGKSITIYPNPVETDLYIRLETGNYETAIYTIRGQLVIKNNIEGNNQMNVKSLAKGIYILKIKDIASNKIFQKKFIKQ